jgi:predicted nuclease of predicted toxin-antitoxin system
VNLLADEGVDRQIVALLRQAGHDVLYIAELEPGITDQTVFDKANRLNALLITADKDFGELVFRQGMVRAGVILLRLAGLSPMTKASIVSTVVQERESELSEAFAVISPGMVRIRKK